MTLAMSISEQYLAAALPVLVQGLEGEGDAAVQVLEGEGDAAVQALEGDAEQGLQEGVVSSGSGDTSSSRVTRL